MFLGGSLTSNGTFNTVISIISQICQTEINRFKVYLGIMNYCLLINKKHFKCHLKMKTLNFNKSEVSLRKHPKLQNNLKLKRNFIFFI